MYKWLWTRIGGRPWTYIRRDLWHRVEVLNIVFFISIGFFSGFFYPYIWLWLQSSWWPSVVLVAGFYFIGVIQGHFYWGTKYVEGQQGK